MGTAATFVVALLALAFLVESMTEYIFKPIAMLREYIPYVALAVGIVIAVIYKLDAPREFLGLSTNIHYVGEVVTGLILGRGSSYVHDLYKTYINPPAA